mgnify:CR=1 FL=1
MTKKETGAFHAMGLSPVLLRAIRKLNYKQPTPIQRKTIPSLIQGMDVVGMARTGSGKTAAFAIPMIHRLKEHQSIVGVRALVVSPTRELALQTGKTVALLAKGTDLRVGQIIGGESLEAQFAVLAGNPDILVATPGRLIHLVEGETRFSLGRIQIVVFDEADQLFEMGFKDQLMALLKALPESRQTALFSATLPSNLIEFAEAGLRSDALFIRLDHELKLSPDLTTLFYHVISEYRPAALLKILGDIYVNSDHKQSRKDKKEEKLTLVFTATKHHVEYLIELLSKMGFSVGGVYGSMDQEARTIAMDRFRSHQVPILIVTDVAARGLDIPMLDVVINYDFCWSAKLFIHRVGRVARAGRTGTAYSLCSLDELPYFCEVVKQGLGLDRASLEPMKQAELDLIASGMPPLTDLHRVMRNAHKQYVATRPAPSPSAIKMAKELAVSAEDAMKAAIHQYKPIKRSAGVTRTIMGVEPKDKAGTGYNQHNQNNQQSNQSVKSDFYLSYEPRQSSDDQVYSIKSALQREASDYNVDTRMNDSKKQKLSATNGKHKKDDAYEKWKRKTHVALPRLGESELPEQTRMSLAARNNKPKYHLKGKNKKRNVGGKKTKADLKKKTQ